MKKILLLSIFILAACFTRAEDNQLMKFADYLYNTGDYYRSISEYKRYIFYNEAGKHVKNAKYKIAMSYLMAGKYEEAADTFDKVALDYDGDLKYMSLLGEAAAFTFKKDFVYSSAVVSRILNDENSVKFSTRSSNRVRAHVPRNITSSATRRGSSSRSMRFHSKNRSQSAVSEPTRLSVPFESMSSALNQKSCGISAL